MSTVSLQKLVYVHKNQKSLNWF